MMNGTAFGIIIVILSGIVAGLSHAYLAASARAIRYELMLTTERNSRTSALREAAAADVVVRGMLSGALTALRKALDRVALLESQLERRRNRPSGPLLDEQTTSLVRLATSNPDEHERHTAAMIVCKRLREKIDT